MYLDDFNVALRDGAGEYRSFKRTPAVKVVKNDPLQVHHELLDHYTDKNMHDIVAYLVAAGVVLVAELFVVRARRRRIPVG